jgi:hypothetical protein
VAQPVSTVVNAITCATLIGLASIAKTTPVRAALGTYALFEAWHAYSHAKHVPGAAQANVVHLLAYAMAFATLNAILSLSKGRLSDLQLLAISCAVLIDLYFFVFVKGLWTVLSGLLVFAIIVFGNYEKLPALFRNCAPYLIAGLFLLFGLLVNETYNCERMMRFQAWPYHAAVEITGLALFVAIAVLFLKWECSVATSSS